MRYLASAAAVLAAFALAGPVIACDAGAACTLGERTYHVRSPDGWDGVRPLPVQIHFHGWGRQGNVPVGSSRTGGAAREAGVLFVAPDGLGRSWDFRRAGSRDTPFARDVLQDVAQHYPTDGTLIVSGYSWGALMAARFACEAGIEVDALLLVAGAFPPDIPCDGRPARVSHVHGTTDGVLPFPYGSDGDVGHAVRLWRDVLDCPETEARRFEWEAVSWLSHDRHEWDCAGALVTMDVHTASHLIPRGWFARHLSEILSGS